MSYYDDASLVVIPSGYKTSKVYAEKPTDGSGDLAFTRTGDTATRVNSAGLVEKVRTNLLTYSNTFTNAAWTKNNVTLTSGQADPNGGTEGTRIQFSGVSYMFQVPSTAFATASVYVRATSGTASIRIGDSNGNYVVEYNLTTAWQRITAFGSAMAGMSIDSNIGGSWTVQDVIVAFAQFETGDVATAYIPTTTAAVSVGPVANVPRLDYLGSTCPRLLLEPQRTNLAKFSEQFNNAAWTKTSTTVTANAATSPDGYQNADLIVPANGVDGVVVFPGSSFTSGTTYTLSAFGKKEDFDFLLLAFPSSAFPASNRVALFNLNNGTIASATQSGTGAIITDYGNGWYRCSISIAATTTTTGNIVYGARSSNSLTSLGNGTDGVYIWGAQLELGAQATSYIPTLAASATRGADACSKTGISSLIGQTEGTLFYEFAALANESVTRSIGVTDGTVANRINISVFATSLFARVDVGGVNQVNSSATIVPTAMNKVAFRYKANDFAAYVNGVKVITDTSGSTFSGTTLNSFAFIQPDSTSAFSGNVNQILFFKTALTDSELATLTTL